MDNKNNAQDSVDYVSLNDMVRYTTLNLRGQLKKYSDCHRIEIKNLVRDSILTLTVSQTDTVKQGCTITLEASSIKSNIVRTRLKLLQVKHLYVTWETPQQLSFCYVKGGRFYMLKIVSDTTMETMDGIDRRREEPKVIDAEIRSKRRSFFHVGKFVPDDEDDEDTPKKRRRAKKKSDD